MAQLAILHPQPLLKTTIKFMDPPSRTPNFTAADSRRRRSPPKGILKKKKNNNTEAVTTESKKDLVVGQVKILKRGEALNTILKEVNDRKATTPEKHTVEPSTSRSVTGGRRVLHPKKKKKAEDLRPNKVEADVLCSTHRLGPDPEIVSKQMKKVSDCFAGSAFSDSPPPSSVPLPGFFRKKLDKDDATTNLRRILGLSLV